MRPRCPAEWGTHLAFVALAGSIQHQLLAEREGGHQRACTQAPRGTDLSANSHWELSRFKSMSLLKKKKARECGFKEGFKEAAAIRTAALCVGRGGPRPVGRRHPVVAQAADPELAHPPDPLPAPPPKTRA